MNTLYPLKFKSIYKEKIWGGDRLKKVLNKDIGALKNVGESWELSGIEGSISVVEHGFLKGNSIEELIEIYMGDLIGDVIYDKFGTEFPLLIKFIDANDYLSIQVHPDDEMGKERHNSYGKTEMWYVIDAEKDAELIVGFNQKMDKQKYLKQFGAGLLREVLNIEKVVKDDVFFMPAGRIHATGPGILFAEIQQTSDITYRIYDWDRVDDEGKPRDLHTELAVDAIDYSLRKDYKTEYVIKNNDSAEIVKCDYFTTNIIEFDKNIERDFNNLDSFVIYMGIEGETRLEYNSSNESIIIKKGETVLIPAVLTNFNLEPIGEKAKLIEVYIG